MKVLLGENLPALFPHPETVEVNDDSYACPKKEWLLTTFYAYFKSTMIDVFTVDVWQATFDCDDFARGYCFIAQACHKQTNTKKQGIAVSMFCYKRDTGEYHAIIAAVTEEGLTFIEPQSGEEVFLSKQEKLSSFRVWF